MEQILPRTEHGNDPRDFYASDSPVLDEYFDSGQDFYKSAEEFFECVDPEVQDDDQVESSTVCHVWFSYLTYTSQANWCETFPETSDSTAPAFAFSTPVLQPVFTNYPDFVVSAGVASAPTNGSCGSTLMS